VVAKSGPVVIDTMLAMRMMANARARVRVTMPVLEQMSCHAAHPDFLRIPVASGAFWGSRESFPPELAKFPRLEGDDLHECPAGELGKILGTTFQTGELPTNIWWLTIRPK
jgi:hypothetical protein